MVDVFGRRLAFIAQPLPLQIDVLAVVSVSTSRAGILKMCDRPRPWLKQTKPPAMLSDKIPMGSYLSL